MLLKKRDGMLVLDETSAYYVFFFILLDFEEILDGDGFGGY